MRKSSNPFGHKPTRLGHQDRFHAQMNRKRSFEKALSSSRETSTTRKKTSKGHQSSNFSGGSNSGCMVVIAIVILLTAIGLAV